MLQDKVLKYDIDVMTNFFEQQVLGSDVKDPAIYSMVNSKPLEMARELSKRIACSLRRVPGAAGNVPAPTYPDPLGNTPPFLKEGTVFSGLLNKVIDMAKDIRVGDEVLERFNINADNYFASIQDIMSNVSGLLSGLSGIPSLVDSIGNMSSFDKAAVNASSDATNFELTKIGFQSLVGIMPLSLYSSYFKYEPKCGIDSMLAEGLTSPVVDQLGADMQSKTYTSIKAGITPLPKMMATSSITMRRLKKETTQDLYKLLDMTGAELENRNTSQGDMGNDSIVNNILQSSNSQDTGNLTSNFNIPFGNVSVNGSQAEVNFNKLPTPSKDMTDLMGKVDNPRVKDMKEYIDKRSSEDMTLYFG